IPTDRRRTPAGRRFHGERAGIEKDERFHTFLARLEAPGYLTTWDTLELSEYGVPQRRSRVVALAGKGFAIPLPRPRLQRPDQFVLTRGPVRPAVGQPPRLPSAVDGRK